MSFGGLLVVCSLSVLVYYCRKAKIAPTNHKQTIEFDIANAKQKSGSLKDEIVRMNSDNAKQENVEMSEVIAHLHTEDLYDMQEDENLINGGTLTSPGNEGEEGHDKYAKIKILLKAVEPELYAKYLDNFKNENVDDVRLGKYKSEFSRDHEIWTKLIPAFGTRHDFLKHLHAYEDV